jgi:hypothetical protein
MTTSYASESTVEKFRVPAGLRVLAVRPTEFRVSSDNAMIDSGSGFYVECWDTVNMRHESLAVHTGRGDGVIPPDVDATDRDRQLDAAYFAAQSIIAEAHRAYTQSHYIVRGMKVDVVKGRKVPKGRYEVTDHRLGNYGPYVDLRDDAGKVYRYVAIDNLKVIPNIEANFRLSPVFQKAHESFPTFIARVAEEKFSATAWGILADWVQDTEIVPSSGGYAAEDLAAALRRLTAAGSSPSLYGAECHNEFRKMFAGV